MDREASNKLKLLEHMLDDPSAGPTDLPLSLLTEITNNFSDDQEVGRGGFAVVYKGRLQNGRTVAVKKLSDMDMDEKKFNQEVGCLMIARHKNIVRFLGYCADTQGKMWNHEGKLVMADARQRLLCFEFMPNGSLRRYITDASQGLEWKIRYLLIKGICQGLHYLHQNKIVHLDLKPENILLDDDMVPKIIDFGLSRHFDENQSQDITSNLRGTLGYLAPEFISQNKGVIRLKLDIYSLGVTIVEILTGKKEDFAIENILKIWSNKLEASQGGAQLEQVKLCAEIGLECINKSNPAGRPTTECIIRKLDEMEKRCGFIDICTSPPVTHVKMLPSHQTVVYTIGDEVSFTEFITDLRRTLASHPDHEDILDGHLKFSNLFSIGERPVLAKQHAEQPARWIHVKVQAVEGEEMLSTTLLMRDDNMYVSGFMNQQGDSFEIINNPDGSGDILPVDEYNPRRLSWGVDYKSVLDADTKDDLLERLKWMQMGREFAMDAVRVLSGFPGWVDDGINPRVALAGLMFMVCKSARMNRVNTSFARLWNNNECFGYSELREYVFNNHGRTSGELLTWKSKGYANPYPISQLQDIYLVLNYHLDHPPQASSMGRGRPRVELLSMRADLAVDGTTVIVFDGKQGHIIFMKEEQVEKGIMVDLVLAGPYTSISASGCFAIKIDIPPGTAVGSSKGDAGGSIKWEWDCYDPEYAKEVDQGPKTRTISSSGPGRNVEVTYAVMSNALEATVQVKLRSKDWTRSCRVHGNISARIGEFKDQIILSRRTHETAHHFSPSHANVRQMWRSLKLDRNVVAVPCGQILGIEVDLSIETSKNQWASNNTRFNSIIFSFHDSGSLSERSKVVHGYEIEVNVAWYSSSAQIRPRQIDMRWREPDISYMVGDDAKGFSRFISELHRLVTEHSRCKDLMADHPDCTPNHPVPRNGCGITRRIKQERLFRVKLEVVDGVNKTSSITLVMRDDNLDVIGFINQDGYYYGLADERTRIVSPQLSSRNCLRWGLECGSSVQGNAIFLLENTRLGKNFATDAVGYLSCFADVGPRPRPKAKQSLVGLMIMVCDSARTEPVRNAIAGGWKQGTKLTEQLNNYRLNWPVISGALLDWRDHAYQGWPQNEELEKIGIKSPEDALKVVTLVFNDKDRICSWHTYYSTITRRRRPRSTTVDAYSI